MSGKKYHIGYTQGVFDMFHVGHLNLLNEAKKRCDILVVGVNSDQLVWQYKNKQAVIPQDCRALIVENIKAVDSAVIVDTLDKIEILKQVNFDAIFIGSDWQGSPRWKATAEALAELGKDVVFLPYTDGISSTGLRTVAENKIADSEH